MKAIQLFNKSKHGKTNTVTPINSLLKYEHTYKEDHRKAKLHILQSKLGTDVVQVCLINDANNRVYSKLIYISFFLIHLEQGKRDDVLIAYSSERARFRWRFRVCAFNCEYIFPSVA